MILFRRVCLSIFIAVVLFLAMASSLSIHVDAQGPTPSSPPLDIILLIDNSRSMISADRSNLRLEAARMFVDYLALLSSIENPPRVAFISYGGSIGRSVTLRPPGDPSVRAGIQGELIEYTDFPQALQAAYDEFQQSGTFAFGRQGVVILMTDGRPCTQQLDIERNQCVGTPEDFISGHFQGAITSAVERLQVEGVSLHVLGLGNAVAQDKARWEALATNTDGAYLSVQTAEELFAAYHRILGELLTSQTSGPFPISAGTNPITLTLPYRQSVAFTFVQEDLLALFSADRYLTLIGPSGPVTESLQTRRVGDLKGGQYEIYHLVDPAAGVYTATLTGSDKVLVWVDAVEPVLDILPVPHPNYVGSPVEISGRLLRNGQPVTEDLEMSLRIEQPDGKIAAIGMEDVDGDGIFSGMVEQTSQEGDYSLAIIGAVYGVEVQQVELAKAFAVSGVPAIEAVRISPEQPEEDQEFVVTIDVSRPELLRQPVVEVSVLQKGKVVVDEEVVGVDGQFKLTLSGLVAASYQLVVTLPIRVMPPQAGANTATLFLSVAPPPTPAPTPTPTPAPVVIELGALQTMPGILYTGREFTVTQPISVSGLTGVVVELMQPGAEGHYAEMHARGNNYEVVSEEVKCKFQIGPLNLLPCSQQNIGVRIRGNTEQGVEVNVSKQGTIKVLWPWWKIILAAFIIVMLIVGLQWLIRRFRRTVFWRRYFTKKGRRFYDLVRRGESIKQENNSEQDTGLPADFIEEAKKDLEDWNIVFGKWNDKTLLKIANESKMEDVFLIVNLIYVVRKDKPVEALRYIQQLAKRGWYQQALAGAILHDLLRKHGIDREFEALIESIDAPEMVNVWRIASYYSTNNRKQAHNNRRI